MASLVQANLLELAATLFGIVNICLCVRANIWNWFFGMLMVSLYTIIFYKVKLYADMSFQLVALCLQFYGLKTWLNKDDGQNRLIVLRATSAHWLIVISATAFLFMLIAFLLQHYTDSTTVYIDALTTAASLVALWMQANKLIEHWLVWIIIDIVSIKMYMGSNLYFTAGLYAFFTVLNVIGYREWTIRMKKFILAPQAG